MIEYDHAKTPDMAMVLNPIGRGKRERDCKPISTTDARSRGKGQVVERRVTDSRERLSLLKGYT
jgi:hypothetical protein